ncbi:MAG: alpha/beta fold hydrolase [Candidatus Nanopelagicales bacterium]
MVPRLRGAAGRRLRLLALLLSVISATLVVGTSSAGQAASAAFFGRNASPGDSFRPKNAQAAVSAARTSVPCASIGVTVSGVECGRLTVPVDWFDLSNPGTGSIAYAIHRASVKRVGTLTYNPGGPGASGLGTLPIFLGQNPLRPWQGLPPAILKYFDIVAWDARGVGASTPALRGCPKLALSYGDLPATGPVDWTAATQAYSDGLEAGLSACYAANSDIAGLLGTAYVVRDLEALREALGVSQWTYWGMSYGTQIGMAYAQAYPTRLRALLLDGSVPPNQTLTQRAAMQVWGRLSTVDVFSGVYGKRFASQVQRVIRALDRRTFTASDMTFDRWTLLAPSIGLLNAQFNYPIVRKQFRFAYQALFHPNVVPQALPRLPRQEEPDFSASYLTFFVNCSDTADRPTVETVARLAQSAADAGLTVAGRWVIERGIVCSGLPAGFGRPLRPIVNPLRLPHGALVLNSIADPNTQWLGAQQASTVIEGARLLTYMGTQHVTYKQVPAPCVDTVVTRYFTRLSLPARNVQCGFVPGRDIVIG